MWGGIFVHMTVVLHLFKNFGDKMTKVKICGITTKQEIEYINEYKPDFAGFVIFFPKSKRNIDLDTAKELLSLLKKSVKSVAVMVKPTFEQILKAKEYGFDFVQIHGDVENSLLTNSPLPVIRAFNVSDINKLDEYNNIKNITGYLFDSAVPGSGKTFDWKVLDNINRHNEKMFFLAGGLDADNVASAIRQVKPDGVDVSSGVENANGIGKNSDKIRNFIVQARTV